MSRIYSSATAIQKDQKPDILTSRMGARISQYPTCMNPGSESRNGVGIDLANFQPGPSGSTYVPRTSSTCQGGRKFNGRNGT